MCLVRVLDKNGLSSPQDRAMEVTGANMGLPLPLLRMDYQARCVLLVITAPKVSVDSMTLIISSVHAKSGYASFMEQSRNSLRFFFLILFSG